jgi:hypothetical protein
MNKYSYKQLIVCGKIAGNFPMLKIKENISPLHDIEAHRGNRGMALLILNLVTR